MARYPYRRFSLPFCLAVAALAVLLAAGCGARRSEQARAQGDIHLRLGQYDQATTAYERALAADANNALAHAGLGRVARVRNDAATALSHFEAALAADPALLAAHIERAYAWEALGRSAEALEAARSLAVFDAEQAVVLEANLLNRQGRSQDARVLLQEAKRALAASEPVRMALAFTGIRMGDFAGAETELRGVLNEVNPDSTAARMGLVEVYRRQNRLPAAVEEMHEFVATHKAAWDARPGDRHLEMQYVGAQLQLALSLLEMDRVDEAVAIAQPIVIEHPDMAWANYVMGACHLARDEVTDALVALQAAATALPDEPMVQEKLAIAQAGGVRRVPQGAPASTEQRASPADIVGAQAALPAPAALDARPSGPVAMPAAADWRALWNTANLARLLASRETVAMESDDAREVLVMAALFTFNEALAVELADPLPGGNPVRAFADAMAARDPDTLRAVVDQWEETVGARRVLRENARGFMLARLGMRGSALEVLSIIGQDEPDNVVAFFNLANMYNGLGMHRLAALTLQRLLARYPQSLEPRLLLFDTLERDGRREEARVFAETSHALYPDEPQVLLQLAEAYAALGDLALADAVLASGVEARPDDAGLRVGLTLLRLRAGRLEAVEDALAGIEAEGRAHGALADIHATLAALKGDWDGAAKRLAEAPHDFRSPAGWALAVSLAARQGADAPAAPALAEGDTARLWPLLAALGQSPGGISDGARAFGQRLAGDDEALAEYALGLSYLLQRLHAPAYDALSRTRARIPGDPFLVAQLMVALERGIEIPERAAKAREVADAEAALPAAWLGLAQVHAALDDAEAQAAALEQALQLAPQNETVLMARAAHGEARGDIALALDSYQRLLSAGASNAAVHNNYAYYLLKSGGDIDLALEHAARAQEQLPANPHVRHTLGLAQLRKGLLDDARVNLGTALEMLPSDPTLLLDFGHLLLQEGDEAQARQSIELALRYAEQLGLPFDRRAEAEALLAGL